MGLRGPKPGTRPSGRTKGTPNKRSLELLQGLMASNCLPAEQIAALLTSKTMSDSEKLACWEKLLPYLYPQQKAIDPQGYLTIEQAAGMLGAQATKFQHALLARINDPALVAAIMEHLRGPQHSSGAESLPAL